MISLQPIKDIPNEIYSMRKALKEIEILVDVISSIAHSSIARQCIEFRLNQYDYNTFRILTEMNLAEIKYSAKINPMIENIGRYNEAQFLIKRALQARYE